jgi:O-antigen/teichoic acid export membrane protein
VTASRAIDGISDIYRGLFQKQELMDVSSISTVLRGVLAVVGVGAVLWLTRNLNWAVATLCIVWVFVTVLYDMPQAKTLHVQSQRGIDIGDMRPRLRSGALRRILPPAIPMGIVLALVTLQGSIPRLYLESWHGLAAVGYFSAILYPLTAGILVVSALGQSALPRLADHFNRDLRAFVVLSGKVTVISIVLGLGVIAASFVAGRPLLKIAYTQEFSEYYWPLVIMSGGTGCLFVSSSLGFALMAARQFYVQSVSAALTCASALLACALLVPARGVSGAAVAFALSSAVAAMVSAACMVWAVWRRSLAIEAAKTSSREVNQL